jgi:hypothetical protein
MEPLLLGDAKPTLSDSSDWTDDMDDLETPIFGVFGCGTG